MPQSPKRENEKLPTKESLKKRLDQQERELVLMSSIVANSPQFMCYLDADGVIVYANGGASAISGYSNDEIMGEHFGFLFEDDTFFRLKAKHGSFFDGDDDFYEYEHADQDNFTACLRCKNNEVRFLTLSTFLIGEHSIGAIGVDVTEQIRLQKELESAKEQAEQSNVAKSEFLSRMSHEIRTPMNAIIGMTSIGKASKDIERKDYCLNKIEEASTHLLGVINDVLDMSKIEAGKLAMSLTEFRLEKMLQRSSNVMGFRIEEKGINFFVDLANDLPATIVSDDQRLAQVITNLLSNAIKFTPEKGSITMSVGLASQQTEGSEVCVLEFCVADTGIGISKENQSKLFNSFEQADGNVSRKYGGTGLGLSISKRIVELLGGQMWVESEEGKGSRFFFRITALRGTGELRRPIALRSGEPFTVLAVDDAPEVLRYFESLAYKLELKCDVALSGEEALHMLDNKEDGYYPIVFVDRYMPVMSGIELTRRIKKRYGDKVIVIMMSAADWSDVEADAKLAGVDGYLPKPLFPSLIVDCINEYLGEVKSDAGVEVTVNTKGCFEGKNVLLVEDIDINREIVISLLEDTLLCIDIAENGREAVAKFRDEPDKYDMIFMDIHMPEMDGYEASQVIRASPEQRAKEIPIVAMTANVFREDIEKCLAAGMNDHIGKPVDLSEIMSKLNKFLGS